MNKKQFEKQINRIAACKAAIAGAEIFFAPEAEKLQKRVEKLEHSFSRLCREEIAALCEQCGFAFAEGIPAFYVQVSWGDALQEVKVYFHDEIWFEDEELLAL